MKRKIGFITALLLALTLLFGCSGGLWVGTVYTSYGLSEPVDELAQSVAAPDEVRALFNGFVFGYEQLGNRVTEFARPSKITTEQLITTVMFLRKNTFANQLVEDRYYISAESLHAALLTIYTYDEFEGIYLSEYYDPEYDRFIIPAADIAEPVSTVAVLTDYEVRQSGDISMKVDVYSAILVDPLTSQYRFVLDQTVGYLFKNTEDGYRLHAAVAYFKSTGVRL
ncbi:MAG: hypothetical protein IJC25_07670 [Clostridia bacterium]|nr:hypothetical protein [Clostridia bacterium]